LYPVFVVCLALAIALRPLLWKDIHLLQPYNEAFAALSLKNWANEAAHFWGHIAAHLTLLHGAVSNRVLPGTAFAFVAPAWSISLEWQFYLVAPVILWFFGKTGTAGWLLFVAAVVGVNFIFAHAMEDRFPIGAFLPQKLIFFWVGMLSFYLWRALSERSDGISEMLLAGIAPLVLLFTLSLPLTIWTCVMCASVSHGMQGIHGAVLRTLRSPILQRLGAMSYSTYLVHMPCLCLLEWILLPHLTGIRQWQLAAVLVPLCSAGVYFASAAMHRLIEAPGMDLGRRLALKAASRTRAKAS
jgi:peptidoglycan/LPS O-acetylase OafA/YrhL